MHDRTREKLKEIADAHPDLFYIEIAGDDYKFKEYAYCEKCLESGSCTNKIQGKHKCDQYFNRLGKSHEFFELIMRGEVII